MLKYLIAAVAMLAATAPVYAQDARSEGHAGHLTMLVKASAIIRPAPIPAKQQFGFVLEPSKQAAAPVGSYARGCLAGGVPLPLTGPAWQVMRLSRNRNWGDPELVNYIERFALDMQTHEHWTGLLIGDMSQPRGGPMLTGHASHQTGLDVDIWYKPMPAKVLAPLARETTEALDLAKITEKAVLPDRWHEGWVRLLRRAASYPEVARIFVHPAIKKELCEAAQYDRRWMTKVRAYFGHQDHFHVRLRCPPGSKTCTPQIDPAPTDGCGKELAYWMKAITPPPPKPVAPKIEPPKVMPPVVATGPKPPAVAAKPVVQAQPRFVTLADLPPYCTAVLSDGKPPLLVAVAPGPADIPMPEPSPVRGALASAAP